MAGRADDGRWIMWHGSFAHRIGVRENGVFSAVVNGGVEDSVMGSGLP